MQIAPSGYYASKTSPPSARAMRDAELVTDTYRELTGRDPMSLAEWVAAHRDAFEAQVPAPEG